MSDEHVTYRELLIGCGRARDKRLGKPGEPLKFRNLTTLDCYPECEPDLICDLNVTPWRARQRHTVFGSQMLFSDCFDEVHAYEVLEHLGRQGDARAFFEHFSEIYRILKPDGYLFATVPSRTSPWAWGDPSHTRLIQPESLCFLDQKTIANNRRAGSTMSDFCRYWSGDFQVVGATDDGAVFIFALQAKKPVREFP